MAINFAAAKAERKNVYVKVFATGTSGSGKSYTALRLATGMANEVEAQTGTRPVIVVFNSEGTRGVYYADEFDYKIFPREGVEVKQEEFTPQLYIDWINYTIEHETVNNIPPIIIIDTLTPAWDALKSQQVKAGGAFKDWVKVNPLWNDVKRAIVSSKSHMIVNARGKTSYEIDTDDKGKKTVRKLGIGADMREGMDYEFTVSFNIDNQTHTANSDKDNTKLFGTRITDKVLTEKDGEDMIKWANSADGKTTDELSLMAKKAKENITEPTKVEDIKVYIKEIKEKIDTIMNGCSDEETAKEVKKIIAKTIKELVVNDVGNHVADYRVIKDIGTAMNVLKALDCI